MAKTKFDRKQILISLICAAIGSIPGIIYFNIFGSGFGFVVLAFGVFIMVALSLPSVSTTRVLSQTALTIVKYNVPLPEGKDQDNDADIDDGGMRREGEMPVDERMTPLGYVNLLCVSGLLASLVFGLPYFSDFRHGLTSPNWPTIDGRITGVYPQPDMSDKRNPSFIGRVDFKYEVNGETFQSNQVSFNAEVTRSDSQDALDDVADYRPKQRVKVYVKPSDPSVAVLGPGLGTLELTLGWLAIISSCLGTLAICHFVFRIFFPKQRRPQWTP